MKKGPAEPHCISLPPTRPQLPVVDRAAGLRSSCPLPPRLSISFVWWLLSFLLHRRRRRRRCCCCCCWSDLTSHDRWASTPLHSRALQHSPRRCDERLAPFILPACSAAATAAAAALGSNRCQAAAAKAATASVMFPPRPCPSSSPPAASSSPPSWARCRLPTSDGDSIVDSGHRLEREKEGGTMEGGAHAWRKLKRS